MAKTHANQFWVSMSVQDQVQPVNAVSERQELAAEQEESVMEHTERGSLRLRPMWELLMQLRALLPYLIRLAPLLDRNLLKRTPDLSDVRKDLETIQADGHDLNTQIRNQNLKLEQIEEQTARLREAGERAQREMHEILQTLGALRARIQVLTATTVLLLAGIIALIVLRFVHIGR
jgi:chromosome segregation ATPase